MAGVLLTDAPLDLIGATSTATGFTVRVELDIATAVARRVLE